MAREELNAVLRKLGVRVRKFYCTRHTFITEVRCTLTDDHKEAVRALLAKRRPKFTGR
jgi:arsenate reductase-like glutaredoxin family protein